MQEVRNATSSAPAASPTTGRRVPASSATAQCRSAVAMRRSPACANTSFHMWPHGICIQRRFEKTTPTALPPPAIWPRTTGPCRRRARRRRGCLQVKRGGFLQKPQHTDDGGGPVVHAQGMGMYNSVDSCRLFRINRQFKQTVCTTDCLFSCLQSV